MGVNGDELGLRSKRRVKRSKPLRLPWDMYPKSARGLAHSGTLARVMGRHAIRQVLECGSPYLTVHDTMAAGGMNQSNPYLRSTLLAKQTADRLRREGCSAVEAKRLVVQVINSEEVEMNRPAAAF